MFTVSHYMPGYMPDDESHVTEHGTAWEALEAWNDDIRHHLDSIDDDDLFLKYDTQLHTFGALERLQRGENVYFDIENYRYAIEQL